MRDAYGLTPLFEQGYTGKGQTVVLIESFGNPTLQQDLAVYDQRFHLPPLAVQQISPLTVPVSDPRNDHEAWAAETTLDVEVVHALAPDAQIVVLTSRVDEYLGTEGLPEFRQLLHYAIDHYPGAVISNSWASFESTLTDAAGQQEIGQWDALLKQATTQHGITVLAAAGDWPQIESFPSDDPWVTSVGGTELDHTGTQYREIPNYDMSGGFSRFFPEPSYQQLLPASVQSLVQQRRGIPDVAADATGGLAIYYDQTWGYAAGTSQSTPIWAALVAIANQMAGHPLGFLNPALYHVGTSPQYLQDFHDIQAPSPRIGGEPDDPDRDALPGWDTVTGLGTPNAVKLLPDVIAAAQSTS